MKDKASPVWPKIVAVVFSIALAGGYVGWRKHQADKAAARAAQKSEEAVEATTLMVGSKNPGRDVIPSLEDLNLDLDFADPTEEDQATIERALMSSSKSMIAIDFLELDESDVNDFGLPDGLPAESDPTPVEPKPEPRTLMPGSKSISGIFRSQPEPEPEPEEGQEP